MSNNNDDTGASLARVDQIPLSAMAEVERSRAIQQVQAAFIMAKKYPRDPNASLTKIVTACQRYGLAERAFYCYPRGGENVTGGSIRLAEVLAQNWGNIDSGVVELDRSNGESLVESFCIDLETNYRQTKIFKVPHELHTKKGVKKLIDVRDIYENNANMAARRLRAVIFGVIPVDIRESAEKQCRATLAAGEKGTTLEERIRRLLVAFTHQGVNQEMVEARIGHKIALTTGDEIVDLTAIFNSIRDKQARRGDFFDFPDDAPVEGKAAELSAKLRQAPQEGSK